MTAAVFEAATGRGDEVSPHALEARDLWFSYGKGEDVLKGVSMVVEQGRITMVLGASGSGKTTLLKLVKGLLAPRRGSLTVLGRGLSSSRTGLHNPPSPSPATDEFLLDRPSEPTSDVGSLPPPLACLPGPAGRKGARGFGRPRARLDPRVAYIPQQLGLVRTLSVLDNTLTGALGRVATLPSLVHRFPRDVVHEAHATLESLGIGHKATERVFALSGGERQRVAIARALMQRPHLIVADEFVSQLDPATTTEIMDAMQGIVRGGVALLMTTHELDIVARYADHVVVLRAGVKVLDRPARAAGIADLGGLLK